MSNVQIKTAKEHIQNYWINEVYDLVKTHAYMSFGVIGVGIEFLGKCLDYYTPWHSKANTSQWHFELAIRTLPSLSKYRSFIDYSPDPICSGIDKKLLRASQIAGNATVKTDIDAAKSKIDAYNGGVTTMTTPSATLSNIEVRDLLEKNIGNVSKAYFDNGKNADLGDAIANLQRAQQQFESANNMLPVKLDLYSELRCGMAHAGLPGLHLHLTSATGLQIHEVKNSSGQITHWVLDAKAFYEDFKNACVELMNFGNQKVQSNIEEPVLFMYRED